MLLYHGLLTHAMQQNPNTDFLKDLNPEQRRAVETTEGRLLILAGAGSGKTSVLTHRMAYLIKQGLASPASILGLTFTNKAAQEMRSRLAQLIPVKQAKQVTLCTFHSFCMSILRQEIHHLGYTKEFSLYDEGDVRRLIKQLTREMLEHEGELPSLETTMEKLSSMKQRAQSNFQLTEAKESWHDQFTKDLMHKLDISMRAYNAVDFDSLLTLTEKLFTLHPLILEKYQERYHYVMIDEYQDTNPLQYRLSSAIAAKHGNLCVVGDDDQAIYGWRGADIANILQFPAQQTIKLEQNYRSTPNILKAANSVIGNNKERHQKTLWSSRTLGEEINIFHAPSENEEAQAVAQRLVWLKKNRGLAWRDMAILYRSNILSRTFEVALMQAVWQKDGGWVRGIPYEVFGGTEFFQRSEIKDLIAYLRAIANPKDQEALLRIINVPRRGISDATLDVLTQINRSQEIPLWDLLNSIYEHPDEWKEKLHARAVDAVSRFVGIMRQARCRFESIELDSNLRWLVETVEYKKAIDEEVKSEQMRQFKWENVEQVIGVVGHYLMEMRREGRESEISLSDFLSGTMLDRDAQFRWEKENRDDRVHLMTFHSAKGLEFSACFLVGLEDHIIPHEKSIQDRGLEEERRLMYVAITRARHHLTLSMARQRKRMGKDMPSQPSRFLFEIPKELLKVSSFKMIE